MFDENVKFQLGYGYQIITTKWFPWYEKQLNDTISHLESFCELFCVTVTVEGWEWIKILSNCVHGDVSCKTTITPFLTHWGYCKITLSRQWNIHWSFDDPVWPRKNHGQCIPWNHGILNSFESLSTGTYYDNVVLSNLCNKLHILTVPIYRRRGTTLPSYNIKVTAGKHGM